MSPTPPIHRPLHLPEPSGSQQENLILPKVPWIYQSCYNNSDMNMKGIKYEEN